MDMYRGYASQSFYNYIITYKCRKNHKHHTYWGSLKGNWTPSIETKTIPLQGFGPLEAPQNIVHACLPSNFNINLYIYENQIG